MTTPNVTSSTDSQMHNNIMAAGLRDRPPMLATGRYPQWRSWFLRYIDTRTNSEALRKCILSEKEAIHMILTGFGDEIYSTIDACQTAQEMCEAIERLQQVNVQFLQQLQPEWSRFVTIVKQQHKLDEVSYHKLFDILKQYQKEVNELRAERLAKNANPLELVTTAQANQDPYYQTIRSHKSHKPSSKPSILTIVGIKMLYLNPTASDEDSNRVTPAKEFALLVKIILGQRCINVSQRHINNSQQSCDSYARMVPAADPIFNRFIKWYQSLVRSFDQDKNNIQAQQKKKMVKTSSSSDNEPCCSKACKKNTKSLNSKITELNDKLFDANNMIYHYKLGLAQVEARLAEQRDRELKYSSKDLDNLLESQRLDKNKEGLGYSVVPPPSAQIYYPPKKDMSWTGLSEFVDDTVTDYSRHAPTVESFPDDAQNINPSVTATEASPNTISPKPFIKFVKPADSPTVVKTEKKET
nr:hypothetical protein [Tanacetum cinerariifolium]